MSSSEPRLALGDGLSEVRARYPVPGPPVQTHEKGAPAVPVDSFTVDGVPASLGSVMSSPINTTTTTSFPLAALDSVPRSNMPTEKDGPTGNERDDLPPLLSLSDLILEAPAWLFSAALHMLAVIILGLLFIVPERPIELLLRLDDSEGFEELSGSEFDLDLDLAEDTPDATDLPQELVVLEEPVLIEPTEIQPLADDTQALIVAAPIQLALTGRSSGMQQQLVDAYGGTGATQRAVMMALRWLERNQASQGIWSLTGKYSNGSRTENREAATGLALLAFQGAGYTPDGDPSHDFTKVTSRAWKSLLRNQDETGSFFQSGRHNGQLYTQAICTIALCELYGMTQNSRYREPAQRAIDYCVRVQASEGGWRYFPGSDSDLSVTGWFVMALQSARMAGLDVPSPTLKRVSGYLDMVEQQGGSAYGYRPNSSATYSMTAEGLLCRQYLGWSQTDPRLKKGVEILTDNLPVWQNGERDVYYWYYATQVCHHMEGAHWRKWNDTMKVLLPEHQVQSGRERGSWHPKGDEWGNEGGRLFVTCLSTFMLEVYYRHLPIYQVELNGTGF